MRERPRALRVFIDVADPWSRRVLREALGARADVRFVRAATDADVRVGDNAFTDDMTRVHATETPALSAPARPDDVGFVPHAGVLTDRERDVLQALAEGMSNRAIGERFGIATSTVKYHLASVFEKLGVHRRAEAVAMGVRRGDVLL